VAVDPPSSGIVAVKAAALGMVEVASVDLEAVDGSSSSTV
jgi:hypothetical protein